MVVGLALTPSLSTTKKGGEKAHKNKNIRYFLLDGHWRKMKAP
jgi:hypothetical protein